MSAKLPKYAKAQEAAPGEGQCGESDIQAEQREHTSVPPAEAEEARAEERRSGGQQESAQRATSARPSGHPANFSRL